MSMTRDDVRDLVQRRHRKYLTEDSAQTHDAKRTQIAADVEAFLAAGKQPTQVPSNARVIDDTVAGRDKLRIWRPQGLAGNHW